MRDDDVAYIVIERDKGGSVGSFLLGALVGAGLALLFAPQSGAETQEEIRARARKLKAQAEERVRAVQQELESRLEQAKAGVQSRIDGVRGAVDQGRQAARDARQDLERRLEQSKSAYRAGIDAARGAAPRTARGDGTEGTEGA
jgi:gas vesicle protein